VKNVAWLLLKSAAAADIGLCIDRTTCVSSLAHPACLMQGAIYMIYSC